MIELFEATPGHVCKLPDLRLDDARWKADALLGNELFRCFGLHEKPPDVLYKEKSEPEKLELISAIGNVLSMPADVDYRIKAAGEHTRILGCDVVKGKPWPSKGTAYERPIAAGVHDQDKRRFLGAKSFAYIPLDNTIEVGLSPESSQEVKPGYVFLSEPGAAHTVHIPSGLITVELVLGGDEAGSEYDEWLHYLRAQRNPNM